MKKNKKVVSTLKKSNKKLLSLGLGGVLLIVIVSLFLLLKNDKSSAIEYDGQAIDYETKIAKPEGISGNSISFPGFRETVIEEGSKVLHLALVNPEFNQGNIRFVVYLDEEQKPTLTTKLVKPGKAIKEIPIPKTLSVGTHKIHLEMVGYADNEEQSRLSGTNTEFDLIVVKKGGK